jgi:hypothetical protein
MFKNKSKLPVLVGVLCVALLGFCANTTGLAAEDQQRQLQNGDRLSTAVGIAIKNQGAGYLNGELLTEGHVILDAEEENEILTVYTVTSVGWFGFENGIFTKVSGSGAIPTVIMFSKNEPGNYSLCAYKEALVEGSAAMLFPQKLLPIREYYPDLVKQQEFQAEFYLKSIGRQARVSAAHVDVQFANINVQASNKFFELARADSLLANCPYWLGTREKIESDVRYIYEKSYSKTHDGYDLITFKKLKEDGSLVEEKKYQIVGNEPRPIN